MPEFYKIAQKIFSQNLFIYFYFYFFCGGTCPPCPPSPTPICVFCIQIYVGSDSQQSATKSVTPVLFLR